MSRAAEFVAAVTVPSISQVPEKIEKNKKMNLSKHVTFTNVFFALMVVANAVNIPHSLLYNMDGVPIIMILRFSFLILIKASLYAGFANITIPIMAVTLLYSDPSYFAGHFIPFSSYPYIKI